MKNKIKVLVFPCGSEIGLEINNSLKWSTNIELYGASSVDDHGKFVFQNYIGNVPNVSNENFIEHINHIIEKYKIDCVYPAHDSVVLKLSENSDKVKCKIIGSTAKTCRVCRSKQKTYELFKQIISTPKVFFHIDEIKDFPVFLKPDVGQGSKGTFIANDTEEVLYHTKKDPSLLILEYLPGKEYTIDCFTDKTGELVFIQGRERRRVTNGISVNTLPVNDKSFNEIATKINNTLQFRGAWFFQLKINKNKKFSLLEIAPRIAGSMAVNRNLGINFPLLSIFDAFDNDIKIIKNNFKIELDRSLSNCFKTNIKYKHLYIDLDDTIIFKNKTNPTVIAFLYQCINNNIEINLITRHSSRSETNTTDVLKKHKILELFNNIFDIKETEHKSDFINQKDSIFIDDSFSERMEVYDKLKIPVFEVSSIECLLNSDF